MTVGNQRYPLTKRYDYGAAVLIVTLLIALGWLQSKHRFLIAPFENDLVGFTERAASLPKALELNGFYPLGYPLLLWSLGPLTTTAFAAAKIVAVAAAGILAGTAYLLSRALWGAPQALVTLLALAVNPYFWQSAIFTGSDMPWAAWQCLALLGCTLAIQRQRWSILVWAGAATGLAYLVRYTALVTVPVVCAFFLLVRPLPRQTGANLKGTVAFLLMFLLCALPQLWISWQTRGDPFFNLQAKNVWFGIYGQGDWRLHWRDVPSDISLWQVFLSGPWRFAAHWGQEFLRWWLYTGVLAVGASLDAYHHAPPWAQMALLGTGGLLGLGMVAFAVRAFGRLRQLFAALLPNWPVFGLLGLYYVVYGASVALVFVQPRFFLALLPLILAAAAAIFLKLGRGSRISRAQIAWRCHSEEHLLRRRISHYAGRFFAPLRMTGFGGLLRIDTAAPLLGVIYLLFAAGNSVLALDYYLSELQPPVAVVVNKLQEAGARPEDVILASFEVPYQYHTAYNFQPLPRGALSPTLLYESIEASGAAFLLFEESYGPRYWPQLASLLQPEGLHGTSAASRLTPVWRKKSEPRVVLYKVMREN